MRGYLLGLMVLSSVVLGGAGCGKVSSNSSGSNTNWLERCASDADCGDGNQCWCNVCTTSCGDDDDCSGGGQCRATDALGCGAPSETTLCVAECLGDADCGAGSDFACRGEVCLPTPDSSVGGGSSGGGGGMSGGGGTAGLGGTSGIGGTPTGAKRFDVAGQDTCVVAGDDRLYCWGSNLYGQAAADPVAMTVDQPSLVQGLSAVDSIALSGEHACALTTQGDVYCWGLNDVGQVGAASAPENTCPDYVLDRPGDYPCQPTPTRVEGVSDAVQVAVGIGSSCARLANGSAACWGQISESFSQVIAAQTTVTDLDLGTGGGCVSVVNGGWVCSGVFEYLSGFPYDTQDIQLGGSTTEGFGCVLGSIGGVPGNVTCFGDNHFGQRGIGDFEETDIAITALTGAKELALGDSHACALGDDGRVHCWGKNTAGAVGPTWLASPPCGAHTCEPSSVEVNGLPPIAAIAAGGDRTCALAVDATLWCWGGENDREFGAPVRVAGPWEPNGEVCANFVNLMGKSRRDAVVFTEHACETDEDCVEVSLDVSCNQTCAVAALPIAAAESAATLISQIDDDACPQARELGCHEPEIACPERTTRAICDAGYCTRDDPEHSGCTDQCACSAQRAALVGVSKDECEGFDLLPAVSWPCPSCEESAVYVVVMNRGSERFSGDAVISWDPQEGALGQELLPAPTTVTLELEPGTISEAIRIASLSAGTATVRVTAAGDCNSLDDDRTHAALPSANVDCD
jgi:hypothetical protein